MCDRVLFYGQWKYQSRSSVDGKLGTFWDSIFLKLAVVRVNVKRIVRDCLYVITNILITVIT